MRSDKRNSQPSEKDNLSDDELRTLRPAEVMKEIFPVSDLIEPKPQTQATTSPVDVKYPPQAPLKVGKQQSLRVPIPLKSPAVAGLREPPDIQQRVDEKQPQLVDTNCTTTAGIPLRDDDPYNEIIIVQISECVNSPSAGVHILHSLLEQFADNISISRCRIDQLHKKVPLKFTSHTETPSPKINIRLVDVTSATQNVEDWIRKYQNNYKNNDRHFMALLLTEETERDIAMKSAEEHPPTVKDINVDYYNSYYSGKPKHVQLPAWKRIRDTRMKMWKVGEHILTIPQHESVFPKEAARAVEQLCSEIVEKVNENYLRKQFQKRGIASNLRTTTNYRCLCEKQELHKRGKQYLGYQRGRMFKVSKRPQQPKPTQDDSRGLFQEPKFRYVHQRDSNFAYVNKAKGTSCVTGGKKQTVPLLTLNNEFIEVEIPESVGEIQSERLDKMMSRCQRSTINPTGWAYEKPGIHCNVASSDGKDCQFLWFAHYDVPFVMRNTSHKLTSQIQPPPKPVALPPPESVVSTLNLNSSRFSGRPLRLPGKGQPFAAFGKLERAVLEEGIHNRVTLGKEPNALTSLIKYSYGGNIDHACQTKTNIPNRKGIAMRGSKPDPNNWSDFSYLAPQSNAVLNMASALNDEITGKLVSFKNNDRKPDWLQVTRGIGVQIDTLEGKEYMMAALVDYHVKSEHTKRAKLLAPLQIATSIPCVSPLSNPNYPPHKVEMLPVKLPSPSSDVHEIPIDPAAASILFGETQILSPKPPPVGSKTVSPPRMNLGPSHPSLVNPMKSTETLFATAKQLIPLRPPELEEHDNRLQPRRYQFNLSKLPQT